MNDLGNLANIDEITGAIIVVGSLIFAILQMRQTRRQRRELAAIEMFCFFGNPKFTAACKRILRLPEGLSADDIQNNDSGLEDSALRTSATLESIDVMTCKRIVPFVVVKNLIGTSGPALCGKLQTWVTMVREEQQADTVFVWFQWLAERLKQEEHPDPADIAYKSWLPSNVTREF